jgi:NAD(P)-dependent dehydrogenase (short-subunit alcohol dehydrogenase family)
MPTGARLLGNQVGTDRQDTLHRTGRFGIRANAILPGAVEGPRIQRVLEDRAKLSGKSVEEEKKSAMSVQSSNDLSIRAILRH